MSAAHFKKMELRRETDSSINDVDLGTGIYKKYNQKYTSITELSHKAQKLIEHATDHANSIESMILALEMHDKIIKQMGESITKAVSRIAGDDNDDNINKS